MVVAEGEEWEEGEEEEWEEGEEVEEEGVLEEVDVFPVAEGEREVVDPNPPFSPPSPLTDPPATMPPHFPAANCARAPIGPPKKEPSLRE